jgi:Family of unknown function (DUF6655)
MTHVGLLRPARSALAVALVVLALTGCGTTRSTDSLRTATEQLLISDAIDRAVQTIDFNPLAGQTVYLDDSKLDGVVDKNYLVSTLRQHLLASGCTLKDHRDDADFIVEARAGAVGTDRNDLLFGIPATNVPQILPLQGVPAAIPEVPLAKRLDQRGVAKISMFAYHRESGRPVWQSGLASRESSSNDVWLFGAGPFQYGSVMHSHAGSQIARSREVTTERDAESHQKGSHVKLAEQVVFESPDKLVKEFRRLPPATAVVTAATPAASVVSAAAIGPETAPSAPAKKTSDRALVEAAAAKQIVPRLTGGLTGAELLKNAAPKTVEMSLPPAAPDALALPHPRFDPL